MFFINNNLLSSFDYHLNEKEKKNVERLVPLNQAKIHLAFRAMIIYKGQKYDQCAIALSEHFIVMLTKGYTNRYKKLIIIHMFDILKLKVYNDQTLMISIASENIYIKTTACIDFAKNLLRNFILSTPLLSSKIRFPFIAFDGSRFPEFAPKLSPSQTFQFTYNSLCSFFNVSYFHDVAKYVHSLLKTGNGIFQYDNLPLRIIDPRFDEACDVNPITAALMNYSYIYGFVCCNVKVPNIAKAVAPLIISNSKIKILRINNVGATSGCSDIAQAMKENKKSDIRIWDLSNNYISDIGLFTISLATYSAHIAELRLENCRMDELCMASLIDSLTKNKKCHGIEVLLLNGNTISEANAGSFRAMLQKMFQSSKWKLRHLAIGPVESFNPIIKLLASICNHLEILKICNTQISSNAAKDFVEMLSSCGKLKELQFNDCLFNNSSMLNVINAIGTNNNIVSFKFGLNSMKYNSFSLTSFVNGLTEEAASSISSLSFDDDKIKTNDLSSFVANIAKFPNLKELSLNRSLSENDLHISDVLITLVRSGIKSLSISGARGRELKNNLIPLMAFLKDNNSLESIDLSNNEIGDAGYNAAIELLQSSPSLASFRFDGNTPQSIDLFCNFVNECSSSNSLINMPFPANDVEYLLINTPESSRKSLFYRLSDLRLKLQMKIEQNRASVGLHSDLSILNDPTIDRIVDSITIALNDRLIDVDICAHSSVTRVVGLPLPFEPSNSILLRKGQVDDALPIQEPEEPSQSINTLQFNSLCIRREDVMSSHSSRMTSSVQNSSSFHHGSSMNRSSTDSLLNAEPVNSKIIDSPLIQSDNAKIIRQSSLSDLRVRDSSEESDDVRNSILHDDVAL